MTVLATGSRRHLGMPLAAALAAGAVVLAGCQSDAEPPVATTSAGSSSPSASPSSSSSPTPSPSPSVEIPAAAREKSEKGAEAFVRYFFDQVNVAWTEPRTGLIPPLSDPTCEFCNKTESTATFLAAEQQRYRDDPVTVSKLQPLSGAPKGLKYFAADVVQNESDIINPMGKVIATDPRKPVAFNIALTWSQDGWKLVGVETAA